MVEVTFSILPGSRPTSCKVRFAESDGTVLEAENDLLLDGAAIAPNAVADTLQQAPNKSRLKKVGMALWELLVEGQIRARWEELVEAARASAEAAEANGDAYFRTYLDLSKAGPWSALPWECLHGSNWLARDRERTLLRRSPRRAASGKAKAPKLAPGWPLRVLVLCGEALTDDKFIALRAEIESVQNAVWERRQEVIVDLLDRPTQAELRKRLAEFEPHVLHFIGHGTEEELHFAARVKSDGKIVPKWSWASADIRETFDSVGVRLPHLVFLNACHSANVTEEGFSGLCGLCLELGVPNVIGMYGAVPAETAQALAASFYVRLSEGNTTDVALASARLDWLIDPEHAAWPAFVARLSVAAQPLRLLPRPDPAQAIAVKFPFARYFVDRDRHRDEIYRALHREHPGDKVCFRDAPTSSKVVLVHGEAQIGKTDLARTALQAMQARNWLTRWVSVPTDRPTSWIEVLGQIRAGEPHRPLGSLTARLPDEEFKEFDAFQPQPDDGEDMALACRKMREGLLRLAGKQPVVIALDHISKPGEAAVPTWLNVLIQHLLTPIAAAAKEPLVFILILSSEAKRRFKLDEILDRSLEEVCVGPFEEQEFEYLLRRYFALKQQDWTFPKGPIPKLEGTLAKIREAHLDLGIPTGGWPPGELENAIRETELKLIQRGAIALNRDV